MWLSDSVADTAEQPEGTLRPALGVVTCHWLQRGPPCPLSGAAVCMPEVSPSVTVRASAHSPLTGLAAIDTHSVRPCCHNAPTCRGGAMFPSRPAWNAHNITHWWSHRGPPWSSQNTLLVGGFKHLFILVPSVCCNTGGYNQYWHKVHFETFLMNVLVW